MRGRREPPQGERTEKDDIVLVWPDQVGMGGQQRRDRIGLQKLPDRIGIACHLRVVGMFLNIWTFGVDTEHRHAGFVAQQGKRVETAVERPHVVDLAMLGDGIETGTDTAIVVRRKVDFASAPHIVKPKRRRRTDGRDLCPREKGTEHALCLRKTAADIAGQAERRRNNLFETGIRFHYG